MMALPHVLLALLCVFGPFAACADAPPESVQRFIELMDDPAVRGWLQDELAARQTDTPTEAAPAAGPPPLQDRLAVGVADLRRSGADLLNAATDLPTELAMIVARVRAELHDSGLVWAAMLVFPFVACGLLFEYGFVRATADIRRRVLHRSPASAGSGIAALGICLLLAAGEIAAFALGSIGAFAVFEWPPLLNLIVLTLLAMIVLTSAAWTTAKIVIAPTIPARRLLPLTDETARFANTWFRCLSAVTIGSWLLVQLLAALGAPMASADVVAALLGLLVLALALLAVWQAVPHIRRYRSTAEQAAIAEQTWGVDDFLPITLSIVLPSIWLLWSMGARSAASTLLLALTTATALWVSRQIIEHVAGTGQSPITGQRAPLTARVVRNLLLVGAGVTLLRVWGIDMTSLAGNEAPGMRLLRGAVDAILILLVADLGLHALRATIDRRLNAADDGLDPDQVSRRARLRTLLPIVRNVAMIVFTVMAALTILGSLGVEIGPLLAGAGVVGVAIGFGAQTLVKDIISGFFFLLDDAFRVGEYIESGSYKGTVESFSLRSVKLRHQRGPLYTVPFGSLGAIVNHSRDWVIDRLYVNVTYDTDLDLVKRLIKGIGRQLAAEPTFAPDILETLKLQGVDEMGDFAIKLRMKMRTRPGRQFMIRRRAYAMIKTAFKDNGVSFGVPTVQVRDVEQAQAAAASLLTSPSQPSS
ncbi:MAG: mechanosensitive ion channel family protein [Geminicoccaceae bacterium]